jgi:hypothetical protein
MNSFVVLGGGGDFIVHNFGTLLKIYYWFLCIEGLGYWLGIWKIRNYEGKMAFCVVTCICA